jgi:hypothetical protein
MHRCLHSEADPFSSTQVWCIRALVAKKPKRAAVERLLRVWLDQAGIDDRAPSSLNKCTRLDVVARDLKAMFPKANRPSDSVVHRVIASSQTRVESTQYQPEMSVD